MHAPFRLSISKTAIALVSVPVVLLVLVLVGWHIAEEKAGDAVRAKASAHGFEVSWDDLDAWPWGGVEFENFEVARDDVTLATFEELLVDVKWFHRQTLDMNPPIQRVEAKRGVLSPPNVFDDAEQSSPAQAATDPVVGYAARVAKMFGGEPPTLEFENVKVDASLFGGPISEAMLHEFETDLDGDEWSGMGRMSLVVRDTPGLTIPGEARVSAGMRRIDGVWEALPARVEFETDVEFEVQKNLSVRFGEVSFDPQRGLAIGDVKVPGFGTAALVGASPLRAVVKQDLDAIEEVRVRGAQIELPEGILDGRLAQRSESVSATPKEEGEEPEARAENFDAVLKRGWDEVFARARALADRLDAKLPQRVLVQESSLVVGDRAVDAVEAFWSGGDHPEWSVTFAAREGETAVGTFSSWGKIDELATLRIEGASVDMGWLNEKLAAHLPFTIEASGQVDFELELEEDASGARPFGGTVAVRDATIVEEKLAEEPIALKSATYRFEGRHLPGAKVAEPTLIAHPFGYASVPDGAKKGSLHIDRGIVTIGELTGEATGSVYGLAALPEDLPGRVDLRIDLPPTDVQTIWETIPEAVRGPIAESRYRGTFAWTFDVEAPLYNMSKMRWNGKPKLTNFDIVDMPRDVDVRRLIKGGTFVIDDPKLDFRREITIPPMRSERDPRGQTSKPAWKGKPVQGELCGDYVYVPLDQISPYLPDGVLTTEDGSFYRHDGFNRAAIRDSMERNIEEREFVRGASTISMQLVKNLFLTGKKTVSRKIREAWLVWLMENSVRVPKTRIIEIYLNVIEYGPGVFGVNHGSLYFFGKRPDELSVNEVSWFVSTFPGPKLHHEKFERGAVPGYWWNKMQRYIDAMYRNGRIDEYELLTAKKAAPRFRSAKSDCTDDLGLNNPHVWAEEVELERQKMHDLRVVQGWERSKVLEADLDAMHYGPFGGFGPLQEDPTGLPAEE